MKPEDVKIPSETPDFIESPDLEFNLWTSPDASGTIYENGNRTWFYFSVRGGSLLNKTLRFNIMNLNRQSRLYSQGLNPFFRVSHGKHSTWQRVKDRATYETVDGNFQISFLHSFTDVTRMSTTYFAFCYPYSYTECQQYLNSLEERYAKDEEKSSQDTGKLQRIFSSEKGL